MSYEEVERGEIGAIVTNTALVSAQPPDDDIPVHHVALILDFHGHHVNTAWEGGVVEARQLAAALLNCADQAEARQ